MEESLANTFPLIASMKGISVEPREEKNQKIINTVNI